MADQAHSTIAPFVTTKSLPFAGDSGDEPQLALSETLCPVPLEAAPMSGNFISRRKMLATIPAISFAALLPLSSVGAAAPTSVPRAPSMAVLVAEYDHITDLYSDLIEEEERLINQLPNAGVDVTVKLQRERGETHLALTASDVRQHAARRWIAMCPEQEASVRAKRRAWTAEKLWELRSLRQAKNAVARCIGLPETMIAADQASRQQDDALARLVLQLPCDTAEAKLKCDCLARHRIDADELGGLVRTMEAIFQHLCTPA